MECPEVANFSKVLQNAFYCEWYITGFMEKLLLSVIPSFLLENVIPMQDNCTLTQPLLLIIPSLLYVWMYIK